MEKACALADSLGYDMGEVSVGADVGGVWRIADTAVAGFGGEVPKSWRVCSETCENGSSGVCRAQADARLVMLPSCLFYEGSVVFTSFASSSLSFAPLEAKVYIVLQV